GRSAARSVGARPRSLGADALSPRRAKAKAKTSPSPPPRPPEPPPLRDVVVQLAAKSQQINALDDQIGRSLATIERSIRAQRPSGHPVDVAFHPWGKLGWSARRGRWRLVVVDEDDCEDLLTMPRECRVQACLVIGKLVDRLGLQAAR